MLDKWPILLKIWYPNEESVAIARYSTDLVLTPLLLFSLVLPLSILEGLWIAILILSAVVMIRGGIILPIDNEEIELEKRVMYAKREIISVKIITIIALCFPLLSFLTLFMNTTAKFFPITFCVTTIISVSMLSTVRLSNLVFISISVLFFIASFAIFILEKSRFPHFFIFYLLLLIFPPSISNVIKINRVREKIRETGVT